MRRRGGGRSPRRGRRQGHLHQRPQPGPWTRPAYPGVRPARRAAAPGGGGAWRAGSRPQPPRDPDRTRHCGPGRGITGLTRAPPTVGRVTVELAQAGHPGGRDPGHDLQGHSPSCTPSPPADAQGAHPAPGPFSLLHGPLQAPAPSAPADTQDAHPACRPRSPCCMGPLRALSTLSPCRHPGCPRCPQVPRLP